MSGLIFPDPVCILVYMNDIAHGIMLAFILTPPPPKDTLGYLLENCLGLQTYDFRFFSALGHLTTPRNRHELLHYTVFGNVVCTYFYKNLRIWVSADFVCLEFIQVPYRLHCNLQVYCPCPREHFKQRHPKPFLCLDIIQILSERYDTGNK